MSQVWLWPRTWLLSQPGPCYVSVVGESTRTLSGYICETPTSLPGKLCITILRHSKEREEKQGKREEEGN